MVRLPGFDNRADVQDRDDKRKIGTVPRPILHIYMKKVKGKKEKRKKEKKGKERNRYLTLLWTDSMGWGGLRNGGGILFASGFLAYRYISFFFLSFLFGLEGYEWWWGDNFFLGDWYCDLLLEHYELKSVIVFIANYFEISK